jgi:hypothetical protein
MPDNDVTPLDRTGDAMTGSLDMNSNDLSSAYISKNAFKFQAVSASVAANTINIGTENTIAFHLDGAADSVQLTNWPGGTLTPKMAVVELYVKQTGTYTCSFNSAVKWAGGSVYVPTATPNAIDQLRFVSWDGGTTILGQTIGKNFS